MFLKIYSTVTSRMGIDVEFFGALCRATTTAAEWRYFGKAIADEPHAAGDAIMPRFDDPLLQRAHSMLKEGFRQITEASLEQDKRHELRWLPTLYHDLNAGHVQRYIRTLGCLGDVEGMVQAVQWVFRVWGDETVLEEAKDTENAQHSQMRQALTTFRAFAEDQVSDEVMQQLEEKARHLHDTEGCTWLWPSAEDVDRFIAGDGRSGSEEFWAGVRARVVERKKAGASAETGNVDAAIPLSSVASS